jgi:hypothetical protein
VGGTVEVPDGEQELNCVEHAVKPGACEDIADIVLVEILGC